MCIPVITGLREVTVNSRRILSIMLAIVIFGCADTGRWLIATPSPGVEQIPKKIGVHPLLTSEMRRYAKIHYNALRTEAREDRIYILPPTESIILPFG